MTISAFPLAWPAEFPRTKTREKGVFKTTLAGALENVRKSLTAFGRDSAKPITGLTISSNVTLGATNPQDPGVAIWFTWENTQICIPVDRYQTVASNLQAIHHVLEARRTELRHGTLALVRATFTGFKAISPPPSWLGVLGVGPDATLAEAEASYKTLAKRDQSLGDERMIALNAAIARARAEVGT